LKNIVVSEKPFYHLYNQRKKQAENNHCRDRKIKPEIFFFYTNITRQPAYPMQFIVKEINDDACQYNQQAGNDDPFPCIAVHTANL
jgi:hypothetical protein